ncbi:MAG: hypothetical protein SGARI_004429 [Bacillariaceae sp.]
MFKSEAEIQCFDPPCDEELKERWYSNGEYFFIKKEAMNTVRRRVAKDDDRTSVRGLEIVDKTCVKEREARIKEAVKIVLERQRTLTEDSTIGEADSASDRSGKRAADETVLLEIAKTYHEVACCAEEIAVRNASLDRKEVEEYLKDFQQAETQETPKKTHRKQKSAGKVFSKMFKWKPK